MSCLQQQSTLVVAYTYALLRITRCSLRSTPYTLLHREQRRYPVLAARRVGLGLGPRLARNLRPTKTITVSGQDFLPLLLDSSSAIPSPKESILLGDCPSPCRKSQSVCFAETSLEARILCLAMVIASSGRDDDFVLDIYDHCLVAGSSAPRVLIDVRHVLITRPSSRRPNQCSGAPELLSK